MAPSYMSSRAQLLLAALLVINAAREHFCAAQGAMPPPMCGGDPFDPALSMCCDTGGQFEVVPIELPPESLPFAECCGEVIVDNRTTGCCMHEPFMLADGVCCGGELQPADPTVTGCCGGALYELGLLAGCCGGHTVVDLTEEICCAGQVIGLPGTTHKCCGTEALPINGQQRCCGPRSMYDSSSQVCCEEKVVDGLACPTTPPPTTTPAITTTAEPTTQAPTSNTPIDLSPLAADPTTVPTGGTATPNPSAFESPAQL